MTLWLIAVTALAVGLLLILLGNRTRHSHGLTDAPTIDLDNRTLFSKRLGLAGRPDRRLPDFIP